MLERYIKRNKAQCFSDESMDDIASINHQLSDDEFTHIGFDMFSDEEATDAAYQALMLLIGDQYKAACSETSSPYDYTHVIKNGVYMPCCSRIVYTHDTDIKTAISDMSESYYDPITKTITLFYKERVKNKRTRNIYGGEQFRLGVVYEDEGPSVQNYFFSIKDYKINPVLIDGVTWQNYSETSISHASRVVGAIDDARHLWSSTAEESVLGGTKTKIRMGMTIEQVKSIFYARSLPLTDTGRKRPILHLVSAHKRRIKEGIDVDINKHVRGLDVVSMHGMTFKIRPPLANKELHARWDG